MSQQTINIGSAPNDGTGDPLRTAFTKCNSNFSELYTAVSPSSTVTSFNTRVGAISLSSLDVTNALTYTPLNKAGDSATGLMVFSAGFTSNQLSYVTFNTGSLLALPGAATGSVLRAINVDGAVTKIDIDSFVNAGTPDSGVVLRGARGTGTVPAAVQSNDRFGSITAHGYGATSFPAASTGLIGFVADGSTFTDTSQPTAITFQVTPSASITKAEQMRLSSAGVLTLAGTTDSTTNTTGTLIVGGGVGIAKTLNVGSAFNLNANILAIGSQPAAPAGTIARITGLDTTNTRVIVDAYVNSTTPTANFSVRGSRGTAASPAAIQSGDIFGSFNSYGYGATGYAAASIGAMHYIAEGLFSDTSQATAISFQVTPTGSVTKAEQMRLTSAGVLNVSTTTDSASSVTGAIITAGGVGIAKSLNVGTNANVTGALNAAGNDAMLYTNTSGQSFTSGTPATVTGWTKVFDRLNTSFVPSTGIFTAPATGYYQISAQLVFASASTGTAGTVYEAIIVANSATVATGVSYIQVAAAATSIAVEVSAVVSLTSGQTMVVQGFQNQGGARTLLTTTAFTTVSINRIP